LGLRCRAQKSGDDSVVKFAAAFEADEIATLGDDLDKFSASGAMEREQGFVIHGRVSDQSVTLLIQA
jgi:hypothetical protein